MTRKVARRLTQTEYAKCAIYLSNHKDEFERATNDKVRADLSEKQHVNCTPKQIRDLCRDAGITLVRSSGSKKRRSAKKSPDRARFLASHFAALYRKLGEEPPFSLVEMAAGRPWYDAWYAERNGDDPKESTPRRDY